MLHDSCVVTVIRQSYVKW